MTKTLIAALLNVLLAAALVPAARAEIDGTVVNGTTGKPQAGVALLLVKPGQQGMRTIGNATSDASGRYRFEKDEPGGGPQLIQAVYQGVTYNTIITPNIPTSGLEVQLYEATKSPANARVAQHMIVIQPSASETSVNETLVVENASKQTFANPALGGIRFFLPPAADGQVRVSVQGPGGMPLPRVAEKTEESDVFKVDYPVKPGETQFSIAYTLPVGSPETFRGRLGVIKGQPTAALRLVAPPGVALEGDDVRPLGQEPQTQAMIYDVVNATGYTVKVTGTGSLNAAADDSSSESDAPQVEQKDPPVYHHLAWLTGLGLCMLGLGLLLLYRSSPVAARAGK